MNLEVIIPAYNEEKRIAGVIKPLASFRFIKKIVVVDDGSADRTAEVAAEAGADLILTHPCNMGKGSALQTGIKQVESEIFLIIDADLKNLTEKHIESMLFHFKKNPEVVMVNGIIEKDASIQTDIQKLITGVRLINKEVWKQVEKEKIKKGYEIDFLIYEKAKNLGEVKTEVLEGLEHVTKMDKDGFFRGTFMHLVMFIGIVIKTVLRKIRNFFKLK